MVKRSKPTVAIPKVLSFIGCEGERCIVELRPRVQVEILRWEFKTQLPNLHLMFSVFSHNFSEIQCCVSIDFERKPRIVQNTHSFFNLQLGMCFKLGLKRVMNRSTAPCHVLPKSCFITQIYISI